MQLYCWQHNQPHDFTDRQAEEIIYALTGMLADAEVHDAFRAEPDEPPRLICPNEALTLAHDGEGYHEHVEQGVICAGGHTCPDADCGMLISVNEATVEHATAEHGDPVSAAIRG